MPVSIPDKKAFAKELYEACRQWADNLHKMLEVAANRLVKNDVEGALTEVQRLQDDELAIDYTILDNSPILTEL